ncbi:MAG: hypothetical protein L0Z62_18005 [Gemmataceae bacterium]|nr:hypothetical protein [Gemmataceae bacterium]
MLATQHHRRRQVNGIVVMVLCRRLPVYSLALGVVLVAVLVLAVIPVIVATV